MKRALLAVSLLAISSAFAAETPTLFWIHEEIVKPSSAVSYETASKDFAKALSEKKVGSVRLLAFSTPEMHYYFVTPLGSFGSLDSVHEDWEKAKAAVGAGRFNELEARGNEAISSYNEFVIAKRAALSYEPAHPRLAIPEHQVHYWDFYYLMPGKEQEAEAVARDYAALFKAKDIPESYTVFSCIFGNDLPLMLVSIPGKSAADLVAAEERTTATLGSELKALQARAMAITRRYERHQVNARPDLSYSPPSPAPPK